MASHQHLWSTFQEKAFILHDHHSAILFGKILHGLQPTQDHFDQITLSDISICAAYIRHILRHTPSGSSLSDK